MWITINSTAVNFASIMATFVLSKFFEKLGSSPSYFARFRKRILCQSQNVWQKKKLDKYIQQEAKYNIVRLSKDFKCNVYFFPPKRWNKTTQGKPSRYDESKNQKLKSIC